MQIAWSSIGKVPNCFWKSSVEFRVHRGPKNTNCDPNWALWYCNSSQFGLTKCREAMHNAWNWSGEMPYCFKRSFVKLPCSMRQNKMSDFDPHWVLLDRNSSLNSPMATKRCTTLEVAQKGALFFFSKSCVNFQGHTGREIEDFFTQIGCFRTVTQV